VAGEEEVGWLVIGEALPAAPATIPWRLVRMTPERRPAVPTALGGRPELAPHLRSARHLVAVAGRLLLGVTVLLVPLASGAEAATAVAAAWVPCTNATLSSGTCVPGYGSAPYNGQNGYYGLPAALAGPAQLYVSPALCPAGSAAAKSGDSCSAPFQLTLSKVTLTPAIGVVRIEQFGYESSAGTNAGSAAAALDSPLASAGSDPAAQWCATVPTDANPAGETCAPESDTSLPVYLAASSPPVLGTVLICVGSEAVSPKDAFEACIQSLVSTRSFPATRAHRATVRPTAVKKKRQSSAVLVSLSAPAFSNHVLRLGTSADIVVTVTTATGTLAQVTLATGLTPGSSAVVTTSKPQFTGVSTLANGVTRGFRFTIAVRARQVGKVTIDVGATAQLSTGTAANGAAQLAVTVG
jgi:hypothetical protein